jgi:hypothetical protein
MKKIFLLAFLFISLNGFAQDSTKIYLQQLKSSIIYTRNNLEKAHKEFTTGWIISAGGIAVSIAGTSISSDASQGSSTNALVYIGSFITLIGMITIIDSHKFVGRAGRWRFEGDKIIYNL